jgi:hypothetical protein
MVMGVPGTVKRPLTSAEAASITSYADNYVRYRLEYQDAQPAADPPRREADRRR